MRKSHLFLSLLLCLLLVLTPAAAQEDDSALVYALYIYSPGCPHCVTVSQQHLPGIVAEFGDALRIVGVDVSVAQGQVLARDIYDTLNVPTNQRGVPGMLIGDLLLVGSIEILARMPDAVRAGLAAGGIPLPDVPLLREAYPQLYAVDAPPPTLAERLAADPIANAAAVAVLLALLAGLAAVLAALLRRGDTPPWLSGPAVPLAMTAGALLTAASLTVGAGEDMLAGLAALFVLALLAVMAGLLLRGRRTELIPLAAAAGVVVALYMAYIELAHTEAVCGLVGNCNLVQGSPYAQVLGIPVAVLGLAGYAALLGLWALARYMPARAGRARAALLLLALGGTAFSAWLTFLEPFVIGASCAWCLTSALLMLLILWLAAPEGRQVLQGGRGSTRTRHSRRPARQS